MWEAPPPLRSGPVRLALPILSVARRMFLSSIWPFCLRWLDFLEVTVGTAAYIGAWLLVMALGDQCVNVLPLDNEGVPSAEIHATLDCGFPATHALFLEPER